MISLKPIPKVIQQKMFDKMRALGKTEDFNIGAAKNALGKGTITADMINSRSTFINMVSNQENPVILSAGELVTGFSTTDAEGNRLFGYSGDRIASGYDELYGSISADSIGTRKNPNKRPIPGIKSIDVSFKGGARAHRETTISWTCWSFDDINRLMPHFLAHGKTVLVQWGWVYDKSSMLNLPNFIGNDGIKRTAFQDISDEIIEVGQGDFDMMIGKVKNFEFTTREDGGFDCSTILSSTGVSLVESEMPDDEEQKETRNYNISLNENSKEVTRKLKSISDDGNDDLLNEDENDDLISLNTNITLKYFLKNIDGYIIKRLFEGNQTDNEIEYKEYIESETEPYEGAKGKYTTTQKDYSSNRLIKFHANKYIAVGDKVEMQKRVSSYDRTATDQYQTDGVLPKLEDVWVTWGWFEDNVISKFLSLTSEKSKTIVNEFRSIEKTEIGSNVPYESTRIRNHPSLETVDLNTYILPGQFNPRTQAQNDELGIPPYTESTMGKHQTYDDKKSTTDSEKFIQLSKLVNEGTGKGTSFLPFAVSSQPKKIRTVEATPSKFKGSQGYIRNMLINTRVIKNAFGVNDETLSAMTVQEGIESLLSALNNPIRFWNFKMVADEQFGDRIKIIDESVPTFDFSKKVNKQSTKVDTSTNLITGKEGVFFFPVWSNNSIVKRQTINAKIPSSMQLAVMYGSNLEQLKQFQNPGSAVPAKEGLAVAGIFNEELDSRTGGLDIAIRNQSSRKIGNKTALPWQELTVNGSNDDLYYYIGMHGITKKLEQDYDARVKKNLEDKELAAEMKYKDEVMKEIDSSLPLPPVHMLDSKIVTKFLSNPDEKFKEKVKSLYSRTFRRTGEMKPDRLAQVLFLTQEHGIQRDSNNSLLIPLELELDVDGVGGIYPGNSYHSTYLPQKYQEKTLFQMFDVNHKVDSSGWTTSITGKMRTTLDSVFDRYKTQSEVAEELFTNLLEEDKALRKIEATELKKKNSELKKAKDDKNEALKKLWKGEGTVKDVDVAIDYGLDKAWSNTQRSWHWLKTGAFWGGEDLGDGLKYSKEKRFKDKDK